jgi:hypothetical protein
VRAEIEAALAELAAITALAQVPRAP